MGTPNASRYRQEMPFDRPVRNVAAAEDGLAYRPGYSPITDQRKPIMMKKPVNMAISPMPP